ncbi:MAG: phosphatidate cytidylyltransferase [Oscillospiraceae bacterium]|nr:phosphatidate cytidylyltransferase [Oscillospiraceae bacterium]
MKQRIITGLLGSSLAVLVLVFLQTWLPGVLLALFAGMGAYEIMHVGGVRNKGMMATGVLMAVALMPILEYELLDRIKFPYTAALCLYILILVLCLFFRYEKTSFAHLLITLAASVGLPWSIFTLLLIRKTLQDYCGPTVEPNLIIYFWFFCFCCAWLTDAGAYFVGVRFGKRKLCPNISPKKTVEGAVGGIVLTLLFNIGFALLFNAVFLKQMHLNVWTIAVLSPAICIVSMVGDLIASVYKRNFGAKDYGRLFPGHGGVMDRFDSLIFVSPMIWMILYFACTWGPALHELLGFWILLKPVG